MARYKSDFIIEVPVEPDIQSGAFNDIVDYNKKVAKKIRGHYDKALQLDNKREFRQEFKKLGKDIEDALNLDNVKFSKLDELNLDKMDLSKPKSEVQEMINKYKKMADYSQQHRTKVNSLSYDKILKDLDKIDSLTKKMKTLDITDEEDEKQLQKLLQDYKKLSNSISRKAVNETGLDSAFRKQLKTMKDTLNVGRKYSTLDLERPFEKLDSETKQLNVTLDKFGSELTGISKKWDNVEKEVEETEQAFDKAGQSAKKVGDNVKKGASNSSAGINKTDKSAQGLVETFKKVSRWSIAAFAWHGFTNQVREAINYIKELDVVLTEISVVTGKSREQVAALGEEFNRMALRLGRTTAEVAKASKIFFRQGKTTAEVMELVEATTIAASVAHINLSEASDYLTSTLNGFQMEAKEAMDVVDKFSAVGANAGTSFEEMAGALKKVAASANNASVDMDHMISYLATVSEVTREAPENIGTSFKTLFARMQKIKDGDMPEELNKVDTALRSIGITLIDQEGQIDSLQTIIEKLGSKWEDLTKNQQAYIATSIAGTRQQVRFISLMDNYDRSLEILETSLESTGEAQLQFGQYLEGVEASINEFRAAVEALYSTLTNSEQVNGFIDLLTDLVFRLQTLVETFGTVGTAAGIVASFIGVKMGMSLIAAKVNADILTSSLSTLATSAFGLSTASGAAATGVSALGTAIATVKAGLATLIPFLGPIAIIGGGAWIAWEVWDRWSYTIGEVNEDLKEFRDASNELNKMKSAKDEINRYEAIESQLEQTNLTLEKRKELEKELEDLQVSIAGKVESSTTAYNKQGEAIADNLEKMREAVKVETSQQIFDLSDSLEENNAAFEQSKETLKRAKQVQEEGKSLAGSAQDIITPLSNYYPSQEEVQEARRIVDEQESLVNELAIKWLTLNETTIDELLDKRDSQLSTVEKEIVDLVKTRGDIDSLMEFSFLHQELPEKEVEKNAKNYAQKYWDHLYDGVEEIAKKEDLFKRIKELTDEQIESILDDPRGHAEEANFLNNIVEQLDLSGYNLEERAVGVEKFIEAFVDGTNEMRESAENVDVLKTSLSDLSEKKDNLSSLVNMLDEVNESGQLNLDDLTKIEEMYEDFDASSMTSIEDFKKFVQGKVSVLEDGITDTLLRISLLQENLPQQTRDRLDEVIEAENEHLKVSLRNNMTYAQKVSKIREGIARNVEEAYEGASMGVPSSVKQKIIDQVKKARNDELDKELEKALEDTMKELEDSLGNIGTGAGKTALEISMEAINQQLSKLDAKIREAEARYEGLDVEDEPAENMEELNKIVKEIDGYYDKKLKKINRQINLYQNAENSLENQAKLADLQANKQELLNTKSEDYNRIKQRSIDIIEDNISELEDEQDILDSQIQTNNILYDRQELTKEEINDLDEMRRYIKSNLSLYDKEIELQKQKLEEVKNMEDSTEKTQKMHEINNAILETQNARYEERRKIIEQVQGVYDDLIQDRESKEQDLRDKIVEYYEDIKNAKVEEVEEDLENFKDAQDEKLRMLEKYQNRVDRNRREEDRNREMLDIQQQMNELRLVDTEASNKKLRELQEEYDELALEKKRDLEDDAIEAIQTSAEEQTEIKEEQAQDEIDTIENKYDDIIEEVRNSENEIGTILNSFSENINSLSNSLRDPFKNMENQVKDLKDEYDGLTDKVNEYKLALDNVEDIDIDTSDKTYSDLNESQFEELYKNKKKWQKAFEEDDEEGMEEAQKANQRLRRDWGIDSGSAGISMGDLEDLFFKLFGEELPKMASGGISTSTQLAQLHGTPSKPEFIFNYDQMRALKGIIGGGSGISIGSLITVEGSINDNNVEEVKTAVKSSVQKLKDALDTKGRLTSVASTRL